MKLAAPLAIALVLAGVAGCKNDPYVPSPWITATARVDGTFVEITAVCTRDGNTAVEAKGIKADCSLGHPAVLRIPAGAVGAGKQTIAITDGYGREKPVTVEVDIPPTAAGPYFTVKECPFDVNEQAMKLEVDGQGAVDCYTLGGARAKLAINATPSGMVTLGGKTQPVPASGELVTVVDLTPAVLALSIDDFLSGDLGDGAPLVVPYTFETDGKKTEGALKFTVQFGRLPQVLRKWLLDVVDGKVDRPTFTPPAAGERKTIVVVPPDEYSKLTSTDRRGTVRELDYVAVQKAGKTTESGTCAFESDGTQVVAKKLLVEYDISVVALADGKVVAEKTFAPKDECPMFGVLSKDKPEVTVEPEDKAVIAWLDTLAK